MIIMKSCTRAGGLMLEEREGGEKGRGSEDQEQEKAEPNPVTFPLTPFCFEWQNISKLSYDLFFINAQI